MNWPVFFQILIYSISTYSIFLIFGSDSKKIWVVKISWDGYHSWYEYELAESDKILYTSNVFGYVIRILISFNFTNSFFHINQKGAFIFFSSSYQLIWKVLMLIYLLLLYSSPCLMLCRCNLCLWTLQLSNYQKRAL